jgi:diguanylate cyclase (GGDEF)-like protein
MYSEKRSTDEIRNRRAIRNIALIFLLFCVFTLAGGIITYQTVFNLLKKRLSMNCSSLASTVALVIAGDSEGYEEFLRTLDTNSEYYKRIQETLSDVFRFNANQITYVYTLARADENTKMFVLDAECSTSPMYVPPGDRWQITPATKEAFDNQRAVTETQFREIKYGSLLSAYAPIFHNKTGEFLGLVGVDITTDQIRNIMRVFFYHTIAIFLLGLAIFGIALRVFSENIHKALNTDSLTRLTNKAHFRAELKRRLNTFEVNYVIMADLDHFKMLNDTYGHEFGDKVLTLVAEQIKLCIHAEDCAARYGGEEFIICRSNVSEARIKRTMERIRSHVEQLLIFHDKIGEDIGVTISLGAARAPQGQGKADVGAAIELADRALYIAKETRNACVLYKETEITTEEAFQGS